MADGGDVVKRITISASGEGIDSTTNSVNSLSGAFDNAKSSLADLAIGLAGIGASVVGAMAGMRAFIDTAGEQSKALADIATHADIAAMSTKEYQQTMFAVMSQGASEKDFTSGFDKIAADIVAASMGTTEFTKLLAANGMAIKSNVDDATKMKQALSDIMTLMQNASPAVQQKVAAIVGVSQSWIPFLKEGVDQFEAQKKSASDLGLIIDDSTIEKAKQFTAEWHTATATWDLEFKASLASILPLLTQMATLASKIIDGIGGISGSVGRWLTPIDDQSTKQLDDTISDVERLSEMVQKMGGSVGSGFAGFKANNVATMLGLPEGATIQQVDEMLDQIQDMRDDKGSPLSITVSKIANPTQLPKTVEANDAVDRAINSLTKHIEQQKADTLAVGLGDAALASFKATAAETAAVQANGGKETDAQKASFEALKTAASDAADALARAKVASEISRGAQTAFLSPEDVQIANQLKGIYGDDIPVALASSEAAALRMNKAMSDINSVARSTAATFATDLVSGLVKGQSLMQSLGNAARNVSAALTTKAFTDLFSGNWIQAGIEGVGAIATGIFGASEAQDEKVQQNLANARQAQQAAIAAGQDRASQFNMQAQLASVNTNTLQGQIQAFDIQANKARADEMKAGGEAIVELEKSLAAQRQAIVDKANQQMLKSYQDFLDSIKTGDMSTLSPQDQLAYAQNKFSSDITGAKNGNQDSIDAVTQDAQNLLNIAKSFFASSTGYADVYDQVTKAIQGLIDSGGLYAAAPDTGINTSADATDASVDPFRQSLAEGGIVGNGTYNKDSVVARYAGGGSIALAGGEAVTRATSVNARTMGALSYINRTGNAPKSDNSEVVRVLAQGFNGLAERLSDRLDNVADRVKHLEDTTRISATQRRVPGSMQKAA